MVIAVVALIIIVAAIELRGFFRQRQWKVLLIYAAMTAFCTGLFAASMLDVKIPTPFYVVVRMFDPISSFLFPTE